MYTITIYNGSTIVMETIARPKPGYESALQDTAYALAQDYEYTHYAINPYTEV